MWMGTWIAILSKRSCWRDALQAVFLCCLIYWGTVRALSDRGMMGWVTRKQLFSMFPAIFLRGLLTLVVMGWRQVGRETVVDRAIEYCLEDGKKMIINY